MDAIDVALVKIDGKSLELIEYEEYPIADDIRVAIRNLSATSTIEEVSKYDFILGQLFASAILELIEQSNFSHEKIQAVGSHGQTILHLPDSEQARTLQIGNANIIANKTQIDTVSDFRTMDMIAGGQGAPLASVLHAAKFRSENIDRVILNLGGVANITILPADTDLDVIGFDSGPGNGLLDDWSRRHNNTNMDKNGNWANIGIIEESLLVNLLNDPYFTQVCPKSTGRDYFNLNWLDKYLYSYHKKTNLEDIQTTLLSLTVTSISDAIHKYANSTEQIYICGGGAHNPVLVRQLQEQLPSIDITTTEKLGMNPDAVEAITFAWLAKQRIENKPGNLPAVTGASKACVLGSVYLPSALPS